MPPKRKAAPTSPKYPPLLKARTKSAPTKSAPPELLAQAEARSARQAAAAASKAAAAAHRAAAAAEDAAARAATMPLLPPR
eukprot:12664262-Alexandrium_andersonii.AAC.1